MFETAKGKGTREGKMGGGREGFERVGGSVVTGGGGVGEPRLTNHYRHGHLTDTAPISHRHSTDTSQTQHPYLTDTARTPRRHRNNISQSFKKNNPLPTSFPQEPV